MRHGRRLARERERVHRARVRVAVVVAVTLSVRAPACVKVAYLDPIGPRR